MQVEQMDLRQYCGLNRPRFAVDPESDAVFFFGNQQVQDQLLSRITMDFNVRGVPKCGVFGRFGTGKTHTLYHVKYLLDTESDRYPAIGIYVRIGPYDEGVPGMGGWKYLQSLILDAIGETAIRNWVKEFDSRTEDRTEGLAKGLGGVLQFGDENLRQSLATILADYFLREGKSTLPAWNWLRGGKLDKGDEAGVTKALDTAPDQVSVLLNLANLCRWATGKGIILLMDEAQHLAEVKKREKEIHDGLLQLAEPANQDLGFIIGYFGTGITEGLPKVLSRPEDVLSRIGVTSSTLQEAMIDLTRLINSKDALREFMERILQGIRDDEMSERVLDEFDLDQGLKPILPFTSDALDRLAEILWQKEDSRIARIVIDRLAVLAADAYEQAKANKRYVVVDQSFVDSRDYVTRL